jgi:hypothetical protein
MDKQQSTTHYTENNRSSNTNPTKKKNTKKLGKLRKDNSSCSTSEACHVNLVTNTVISHERRKDQEVLATSRKYPWSFVTQIFHQPSHGGDSKAFKVKTST